MSDRSIDHLDEALARAVVTPGWQVAATRRPVVADEREVGDAESTDDHDAPDPSGRNLLSETNDLLRHVVERLDHLEADARMQHRGSPIGGDVEGLVAFSTTDLRDLQARLQRIEQAVEHLQATLGD